MKTIFITGSTGFVGTALCRRMLLEGWRVCAAVRTLFDQERLPPGIESVPIGSIGPETIWAPLLAGMDIIVHLAARTHVTRELDQNSLQAYLSINVEGTERLARSAAAAGVKRFIYLSSVKVNGAGKEEPYSELDAPAPKDAYGISKTEAEKVLHRVSAETGMQIVIIRPPLVYGPGVKANFLRLMQIVDRRIPLPMSRIQNSRSMIYRDNLVDAIMTCIVEKNAAGKTYLVSDGEDVSTPELIRRIAASLERKACLFPVSPKLIQRAGKCIGITSVVYRLLGTLTVDSSRIQKELNWTPPYTMERGLEETAKWFKRQKSKSSF